MQTRYDDAHDLSTATRPSSSPQRQALEICATVIAGPPPAVAEVPGRDTLITTRWLHPELHEFIPGLPVHVVAAYYGAPAPRLWRCGGLRFAGTGRAGGVGIVPAGHDGHWDIDAEASLSYVLLSDLRLQGFAEQSAAGRRIELIPSVAQQDPVGSQILRALSRCSARADGSARLFVEQALDLLCAHLLRAHSSLTRTPAAMRRGLLPWQVRRVTAYMRDRLDQDVGLDELAAVLGLSRFHFCTAFRQATGQTPYEGLIALRMERARQLLRDRRARITDVALAVGYKTPSAFTATFHRVVGTTPSEFRRDL